MWKRKIEDSRVIIVCIIAILLCSVGFSFMYYREVNAVKFLENIEFEYDNNYLSYIDIASVEGRKLVIEGWVTQFEHDEDNLRRDVVLLNEKENVILLHTVQKNRTSVTAYFNDGLNHDASGYKAIARVEAIPDEGQFQIGIVVSAADDKKYLVKTDKSIMRKNGELMIGEWE